MRNVVIIALASIMLLSCYSEGTERGENKDEKQYTGANDRNIDVLIEELSSMDYETRMTALRDIVNYGEDAIESLKKETRIPFFNRSYYSLRALGEIGPEALPALLDALVYRSYPASNSLWMKQEIYSIMNNIDWDQTPGLINVLNSNKGDHRSIVYEMLCHNPEGINEELIEVMIECIKKEEGVDKLAPAEVIVQGVKEGHNIMPEVIELLRDEDDLVRVAGAYILWTIGEKAKGNEEVLLKYMNNCNCSVEMTYAAAALRNIKPLYLEENEEYIFSCLEMGDDDSEKTGIIVLGYLSSKPHVINKLIEYLNHEEPEMRRLAATSLGEIGIAGGEKSLDSLIAAFGKEEDGFAKRCIINAIGKYDSEVKVIQTLSNALSDDYAGIREDAAQYLGKFGVDAKEAVPELVEALKDKTAIEYVNGWEEDVKRYHIATALGLICGQEEKHAILALRKALKSPNEKLRIEAAVALYNINQDLVNVVRFLENQLDDRSPLARSLAAEALGNIGLEASPALEKLRIIGELDAEYDICIGYVEAAAREAIEKIEGTK